MSKYSPKYKKEYYEENKERILARTKARYDALSPEDKEVHLAKKRAYHADNKNVHNRGRRDRYLKDTYGISLDEYEAFGKSTGRVLRHLS